MFAQASNHGLLHPTSDVSSECMLFRSIPSLTQNQGLPKIQRVTGLCLPFARIAHSSNRSQPAVRICRGAQPILCNVACARSTATIPATQKIHVHDMGRRCVKQDTGRCFRRWTCGADHVPMCCPRFLQRCPSIACTRHPTLPVLRAWP